MYGIFREVSVRIRYAASKILFKKSKKKYQDLIPTERTSPTELSRALLGNARLKVKSQIDLIYQFVEQIFLLCSNNKMIYSNNKKIIPVTWLSLTSQGSRLDGPSRLNTTWVWPGKSSPAPSND